LGKKKSRKKSVKEKTPEEELRANVWQAYVKAYTLRWGHEPARNAKNYTHVRSLVERVGKEALELVGFYLQHNDSFFVKECHPIGILVSKCEGLLTQMRREQPITSADVRRLEIMQRQQGMLDEAAKGGF